jgi:hypothetical protein
MTHESQITENQMRNRRQGVFGKPFTREIAAAMAFVALITLLAGHVPYSLAQEQGQQTFRSAEEAGRALFAAAQNQDDKTLLDILGAGGREIISSGDPVEDSNERVGFVVKYEQMHRYARQADGTTTLYVGAENWPFPIPLVENDIWFFDADAGKQEILMRRIGKNELAAIDACHQLVDAEKQYYAKPPQGESAKQYAQKFVSDKGRHNGLFWSETVDELDSPLNPLIASAGADNTKSNSGATAEPIPFNGYYVRLLTGQGINAKGGAKSYVVNGKMAAGFAFLAYPSKYRSSGVMTFIVNESGVVYEKDLGPNTTTVARSMTEYNPDSTWHRAD